MAIPSEKSPAIENFLNGILHGDRSATIRADKCVICGGDANVFRDLLSRKEYRISGLCQKCQDATFGV